MDDMSKAEKILAGTWPMKDPVWIYESPDKGETLYRRLFGGKYKQLFNKGDDMAKLDAEYFAIHFNGETNVR
jgi:hypothetical protein|tara:strand:+ start:53 stop:268 length:216 start_codon:yes stop_codon:yes gene_type:complete